MQEMALHALEREELEYLPPPAAGRPQQGQTHAQAQAHPQAQPPNTQLAYALEELNRAVLAPAGLSSKTRMLGISNEVMASISLMAQEHAAGQMQGEMW